MLYEQKTPREPEDESTEERDIDGRAEFDELLDVAATTSNQYYPSSMGMSFYASGENPALIVHVTASRYRRLEADECGVYVGDIPNNIMNSTLFLQYLLFKDGMLYLREKISKDTRDLLLKLNEESQVWWGAIYRLFDLQTDGWIRIPLDNDPIRIVIPHVDSRKPTKEPSEVCEGLN